MSAARITFLDRRMRSLVLPDAPLKQLHVPDGLRLDEFGNLWISSLRGVEVFAPDGTPLGIGHVPETVSKLTFGGPKRNRLFITATASVHALFTAVRGATAPRLPDAPTNPVWRQT